MPKLYTLLFVSIFLFTACHSNKQADELLTQVDSLLKEQPDSALQLLNALPNPQELSHKETARYALLMARATDKAVKSLLPCDSLLNLAQHYYDNDEKERAVALLYKGRLEEEMNNPENAIANLQEGLTILKKFPNEVETKRLTLNSLGNLYFDARYYEESIKMYREMYNCCETNKDKSIASHGISSYYSLTDKEDSAIINQNKALEYALLSKDSMQITASLLGLSLSFSCFNRTDSALYYARKALTYAPHYESKGRYYSNLAYLLVETKNNKDSAIYYFNKSMEDKSFAGRFNALLSLSDLEKEKGNFEVANRYLDEYITNTDSIITTEKATEIQQLIYDYKTKEQIRKEKVRSHRQMRFAITNFIFILLLITISYQYRINKRKKVQLIYQQNLNKTQSKIFSLQSKMEENIHAISHLQKEYDNLKKEKESNRKEIEKREHVIEKLKEEKQELRSWLFTQSDIFKKVAALSNQEGSNKKDLKVMTNTDLGKLKETIFGIYTDYISEMQEKHPKLVEDDLLYLCLEKAKLSPQTIALCFGFSDTHTINQRKYRIKDRMNGQNV